MKTYRTGENAGYGLYMATNKLDVRFVGSDGETIEGKEGARYVRLPTLLMVLFSPVLGGIFVMTFPVLVVLIAVYAVVQVVSNKTKNVLERHLHWTVLNWDPTAAYLNKKKNPKNTKQNSQTEKD